MIWWIPLALIVPLFFFWIVVHEGAHALSALAEGLKIKSFKPWPHKISEDNWCVGYVIYDKPSRWAFTCFAPYCVDFLFFVGVFVAILFVGIDGWIGTILVTVLVCPLINTATAVYGRFTAIRKPDLSKIPWWCAAPFFFFLLLYCGAVGVLIGRVL